MFNLFKKKEPEKTVNPFIELRSHYMGNVQLKDWPKEDLTTHPWSLFVEARKQLLAKNNTEAEKIYRQIVETPDLEPRHYMQAWMFLRYFLKVQPSPEIAKTVYAVMVEVSTETGVMSVVAYTDHKARSLHSAGGGVVWENPNNALNEQTDALIKTAEAALEAIPLVVVDVLPNPPKQKDYVLISIATPSGIYHGLGTGEFMWNDPHAGPILNAGGNLLKALEGLKK